VWLRRFAGVASRARLGGALPTASINEVLRRQRDEELAQAMSALDADIDPTGTLLDGDARELLPADPLAWTCS
jgi:hypothetical protein